MKKLFAIILFGIAFGLLEATVVIYIQNMLGNSIYAQKPYHTLLNLWFISFISPQKPALQNIWITTLEEFREAATIIMLVTFAYAAGKSLRQKIGVFLISFAVWDLCYYLFLHLLIGWPKSIFDIDVYFLIPVVWVGPVITPLLVSIFLFIFGVRLWIKY